MEKFQKPATCNTMLPLFLLLFLSLKILIYLLFLATLGLRCRMPAFSSCGYSLCCARTSHCGGFLLWSTGTSVVVVPGLSCPAACGDLTDVPCTGRWINTGPPGKSYYFLFLKMHYYLCITMSQNLRQEMAMLGKISLRASVCM